MSPQTIVVLGLLLGPWIAVELLLPGAAEAATVSHLNVTKDGSRYHAEAHAHLDASPRAVHAALTGVSHYEHFDSRLVRAKTLERLDPRSTLVDVETRACILVFCRTVKQRQVLIDVSPSRVVAITKPEGSNLRHGRSEWQITAEDSGTRLEWNSTIEPDFWVPPFVGPALIRKELENQGRRFVEGVERHARSHPTPPSPP